MHQNLYLPTNELSKILIIRPRYLGDVLLTTPIIKALKVNLPECYVAYLTEENFVEALQGNPYLDKIFTIKQKANLSKTLKVINILRKQKFDIVIDLFGNPRSAIITYLTGAKKRVGFNYPVRRRLYNVIIKDDIKKDAIGVYLNVLKNLGINSNDRKTFINLTKEQEEFADNFFARNDIKKNDFVVGLNPGASSLAKRWHKEKFALLGKRLIEKYNAKILIFEGYKEIGIAKEILDHIGTVQCFLSEKFRQSPVIANNLTIKQLASLIKRCSVFITNDAGPMHVAVAVSTPTVAIFGPGEPDIWFPYTDKKNFVAIQKKLECSPCNLNFCENHRCMDLITVEDVLSEINKIKNENSSN